MDGLKQGTQQGVRLAEPRSYDEELENHEHVSTEVERAAQMLKRLDESVSALANRLGPILIGDANNLREGNVPEPVRCALATRIAATADIAYDLVCRIDEMRASVDL